MIISLAPIQGITDFRFRRCFQAHFGGVNRYYAPYIRLEKGLSIPKSRDKDVDPANNQSIDLIPQVMSGKSDEILLMAQYLHDLGYTEMNWNLGCPYPMVTNRQMGAGLLPHPEIVESLLSQVLSKTNIKISVKLRLGLADSDEIEKLIPILNNFPLEEIILHPRIGKDLYKGEANREKFEYLLPKWKHPIAYNGDLVNAEDLRNCQLRFKTVDHWMIGRALISNPFLAEDITDVCLSTDAKMVRFRDFHDSLTEEYLSVLSGSSHLITRMRAFWEYFALSFSNPHKVFKRIKKSNSIDKYHAAVRTNFSEESWLA